jgi:GTP-binding protein Era
MHTPDTKALRALILKYLPEQDNIFDADYVTDRSEKFVVAEFIREKLKTITNHF